jgi:taurine dioxygenase
MQEFLDGLRAVHHNPRHQRYEGVDAVRSVHPVVRVHPETGEKALFVNPMYTSHIVGLTPQEGRQILAMLYRHLTSPEFTVRFRWEPDSIAFWDNRSACHRAPDDVPVGTHRTMHRITLDGLDGEVPVGPDGFRSQPLAGES